MFSGLFSLMNGYRKSHNHTYASKRHHPCTRHQPNQQHRPSQENSVLGTTRRSLSNITLPTDCCRATRTAHVPRRTAPTTLSSSAAKPPIRAVALLALRSRRSSNSARRSGTSDSDDAVSAGRRRTIRCNDREAGSLDDGSALRGGAGRGIAVPSNSAASTHVVRAAHIEACGTSGVGDCARHR